MRGKAPITKEEVRSISISKLRLTKDAVVVLMWESAQVLCQWRCAGSCSRVWYTPLRKEDAVLLMEKNRQKFGAANLHIVRGNAPDALAELRAPASAFLVGAVGI